SATYDRMRAERDREVADAIAKGNQEAQLVRATADKQALQMTSEARSKADMVRGQADAEANAIYAKAYSQDPEFFAFFRSLNAYPKALDGSNTTMVLSPNTEFFNYLKSNGGGTSAAAPVK
ncbi:MAG: protease modulator HflC, partial [Paracoccaceae bacterium]|nr:protease modulator HflC [Paracoccaceae bacterium]